MSLQFPARPSPEYPSLHAHVNPVVTFLSVHEAFASHGLFCREHSSSLSQAPVRAFNTHPGSHLHSKLPGVLKHCALFVSAHFVGLFLRPPHSSISKHSRGSLSVLVVFFWNPSAHSQFPC